MANSGSNSIPEAVDEGEGISESWSRTCPEMVRGFHTWRIEDFDVEAVRCGNSEPILSPYVPFGLRINGKPQVLKFFLRVRPDGNDTWGIDVRSSSQAELYVRMKIVIQDTLTLTICKTFKPKIWHGWNQSIPVKKCFPDDKSTDKTLKITCEFEVYHGFYHQTGKNSVIPDSVSLAANLRNNFFRKKGPNHLRCSDVVLECRGGSFRLACHKFVLSARSPVFAAMFSHPMKEATDNRVEIPDSEPYDKLTFARFIFFLYTDDLRILSSFKEAMLMLPLADKYCVEILKIACERIICDRVNLGNVLEAMQLAYIYNATHLLSFTVDFVIQNLQKLVHTPEFLEIVDNCPELPFIILMKATLPVKANGNPQLP